MTRVIAAVLASSGVCLANGAAVTRRLYTKRCQRPRRRAKLTTTSRRHELRYGKSEPARWLLRPVSGSADL